MKGSSTLYKCVNPYLIGRRQATPPLKTLLFTAMLIVGSLFCGQVLTLEGLRDGIQEDLQDEIMLGFDRHEYVFNLMEMEEDVRNTYAYIEGSLEEILLLLLESRAVVVVNNYR